MENEEKVYEVFVGWINYDLENRWLFFFLLMEDICLFFVFLYYLVDVVEYEEFFNIFLRCKELLFEV